MEGGRGGVKTAEGMAGATRKGGRWTGVDGAVDGRWRGVTREGVDGRWRGVIPAWATVWKVEANRKTGCSLSFCLWDRGLTLFFSFASFCLCILKERLVAFYIDFIRIQSLDSCPSLLFLSIPRILSFFPCHFHHFFNFPISSSFCF